MDLIIARDRHSVLIKIDFSTKRNLEAVHVRMTMLLDSRRAILLRKIIVFEVLRGFPFPRRNKKLRLINP